jgi:hypothetical protein
MTGTLVWTMKCYFFLNHSFSVLILRALSMMYIYLVMLLLKIFSMHPLHSYRSVLAQHSLTAWRS